MTRDPYVKTRFVCKDEDIVNIWSPRLPVIGLLVYLFMYFLRYFSVILRLG